MRYVQELLGHRDLNSTTIYTHLSPDKLAKVHSATHPGATNQRQLTKVSETPRQLLRLWQDG
ncbi:MAG: hypothetical protein HKL80_11360 [Acidimicrobiales bacterium]|nr:hypothetical protein [Acidimicrobiales bacterium]